MNIATKFFSSISIAAFALVPIAAQAEMTGKAQQIGTGPHGYDFTVGTWSCTNSMPSAAGGPANQTTTVTRTGGGQILYRTAAGDFDVTSYSVYVAAKKMWLSPFAVADGTYGSESTTQTGKTVVWTGTQVDPSGTSAPVRDTDTYDGMTKYTDLGEVNSEGTWKAQYKLTCTKS